MDTFIKQLLVTCALPYSNGSIHLGHMLEHIQADIWVRYQRMRGKKVYFICADDCHGTPIMLKAQQLGITPEEMIINMHKEHKKDFSDFFISYDHYYFTHSIENKQLAEQIFLCLKKKGYIKNKIIFQFYDSIYGMFLSDRLVKGMCSKCNAIDQYGDNCEICGATYDQTELINPYSVISKSIPEIRKTKHFFFDLPIFKNMLQKWIYSGVLPTSVINKIQELFIKGLKQWDITRDHPYFGFQIPNENYKYFYVWLDAPIGYISTFKNFCKKNNNINFNNFWYDNTTTELYHFIGKDIIYFHSLFWPAILEASGYRKPNGVFVHGYLTINGTKMSKSRNTYINARCYLNYLDADCLRYYYASKLSSDINDIDLNFEDFIQKINSDIVNKIVNLAARNVGFITKYFNNQLSAKLASPELYNIFVEKSKIIGHYFYNREFNKVIREIILLVNLANRYIDNNAPWMLVEQQKYKKDLHNICSMGINLFKILMTFLKPILPGLTDRSEKFLNISLNWNDIKYPLLNHNITPFKILFKRININQINMILKNSKYTTK